jgi:transposase-like protein
MNRIVALILTLQQHLDSLVSKPVIYRPSACPNCSFGKLWCHGCYERKADRYSPTSESLNPIPILRFLCLGCHKTCSRLPECIAPRRWYDWTIQQVVLLALLNGRSIRRCSQEYNLARRTISRWWRELQERSHEFELFLRARFPELGRSVDFADFWQNCWQAMPLSRAMYWLDREGVVVP